MIVATSTRTDDGPEMVTVSVTVNVGALIVGGGSVTVNVTTSGAVRVVYGSTVAVTCTVSVTT